MEPNVELDLNVELNVDCLAQHTPRFGFRSSESFANSNVELNVDCRARH